MESGSCVGESVSKGTGATFFFWCLVSCALFLQESVVAQQAAWPLQVLRPPGSDLQRPELAAVAISGEQAFSAYMGTSSSGYRVFARTRSGNAWTSPQLLVQGLDSSDSAVTLSSDNQRLAVGAPWSAGGGSVGIYARIAGSGEWALEQLIPAPIGAVKFGRTVSLKGSLLVVTSADGNGAVHSFRRDSGSGWWSDAGFGFVNNTLGSVSAVTDGVRIAYCRPLSTQGCATAIYSDGEGWQTESTPSPAAMTGGPVLGVSNTELFIRNGDVLSIYAGIGSAGLSNELQIGPDFIAATDGYRIVAGTNQDARFFSPDGFGLWLQTLEVPLVADAVAVQGYTALAGNQSFRQTGSPWIPNGVAGGLSDLSESNFGVIEKVGAEIWVGAGGAESVDQKAGAVFAYSIASDGMGAGNPILVPENPAFRDFFGALLTADNGRVAIASSGRPGGGDTLDRVSIFDSATREREQVIDIPNPGSSILDITLRSDTLAISRKDVCSGSCTSDVLIYRYDGDGFVLVQTLVAPGGTPTAAQFAQTMRLNGDWLLSGKLAYRRSTPTGDFEYQAALARPAGMNWAPGVVSRSTDPLVVATFSNAGTVGLVYAFDNANGWVLSGALNEGGMALSSDCLALDAGSSGIACVAANATGERLYLAIKDAVGSDWSFVGQSPDLAPALVPAGKYSLVMTDAKAFVGHPNTAEESAGIHVGKVTVLTFDEAIFASGFD